MSAVTAGPAAAPPVLPGPAARSALRPLADGSVSLAGGELTRRQRTNAEVSLRHGYEMLTAAGTIGNFTLAAGRHQLCYAGASYADSDVYKWLEAVQWQRRRGLDEDVAAASERVLSVLEDAQLPDGYLHTYMQVLHPAERYQRNTDHHETYNLHHLIQAGIAEARGGGDGRLLELARRGVDQLDRAAGRRPTGWNLGHPGIEMALVELSRLIGEPRYLDLARRLLDARRGRYDVFIGSGLSEWEDVALPTPDDPHLDGHAVCALYLAAGMTDVLAESGDARLEDALATRWDELETSKSYVTGGVGSRHAGEAFGRPYELPSARSYCETCAGIAVAMWSWRMLLLHGDARYADRFELVLHNAVLAGVGLDGASFFYANPLASDADVARAPWFRCPCCPTNVMRFLAQLEQYLVTVDGTGVQIQQYAPLRLETKVGSGTSVALRVDTDVPSGSRVTVTIERCEGGGEDWTLGLRIPSWCQSVPAPLVNGVAQHDAAEAPRGGYLALTRRWQPGDVVVLELPQQPELVEADWRVHDVRGQVAVRRGPVVYCAEHFDQRERADPASLELDVAAGLEERPGPKELGSAPALVAAGRRRRDGEATLYRVAAGVRSRHQGVSNSHEASSSQPVVLVPYALWANRGRSRMRVWFDGWTRRTSR
ncbi:MAG: beta-L-arabinofuranosidase domain-containing protein [Acidimicrobiales bacterium]